MFPRYIYTQFCQFGRVYCFYGFDIDKTILIYHLNHDFFWWRKIKFFSGKIACANVLSDLYAMGVTECDNMLMLLAVSTKMTEKERDVVVPLMMRGFKDCALEANSTVTGGQTVMNPWCTIGGVATTVCQPNEFIM